MHNKTKLQHIIVIIIVIIIITIIIFGRVLPNKAAVSFARVVVAHLCHLVPNGVSLG